MPLRFFAVHGCSLTALALLELALGGAAHAASTPIEPDFKVTSFHASSGDVPLFVDEAHAAVHRPLRSAKERPPFLGERAAAAFEQLGLTIVELGQLRDGDAAVGLPVWFDRAQDAVGVLTNEIIVRGDDDRAAVAISRVAGLKSWSETTFSRRLFRAQFVSPDAALKAANSLARTPGIRFAHPNFLLPKDFRGNSPAHEPYFSRQWHLENNGQLGGVVGADINVNAAWAVTTGTPETLVAVLDGGFELTHPDLERAWYRNVTEIPGNGVDDDLNGYVDDVTGWNFWAKSADPSSGLLAEHGTAAAGLIGARANGKGMTGVCPECTILPIVVGWEAASDAEAFYYAEKIGAPVISNSWGYPVGTPVTDVVVEAIDTVARRGRKGKGTIVLFAMNNLNIDDCVGDKPDISSLASVIAVSASSDQDKKVSSSGWGACMEILAPTYETNRPGIATTDLTGDRGYNTKTTPGDLLDLDYTNDFGGTSAATPITAGVFALMLSINPELTRNEALAIVEASAAKIDPTVAAYDPVSGFSKTHGFGRIDAGKAVRAAEAFRKYSRSERPSGQAQTKTY